MRALLRALAVFGLGAGGAAGVSAADSLPPPPTAYFNDYAGLVSAADAERLDAKLRQFAEQTSTQVVVAVFRELPSPSLEDFTVRVAESWRVGRKDWDNGAVFFVFVGDRKMRIETGYGLEGALPDQLAGRILDNEVRPRFRDADWAGGLEAGIDAILAATRGEYQPPPEKRRGTPTAALVVVFVFVLLFFLLVAFGKASTGQTYSRQGAARRGRTWGGGSSWGGGGWSGGGAGWGGGGGGGFSGGGGSFGGGGASSSW